MEDEYQAILRRFKELKVPLSEGQKKALKGRLTKQANAEKPKKVKDKKPKEPKATKTKKTKKTKRAKAQEL